MTEQAIAARLTAANTKVCPNPADCCLELSRVWAVLGPKPIGVAAHEHVAELGAHVEALTQQVAELRAERTQLLLMNAELYHVKYLKAEQQRDAALAALREMQKLRKMADDLESGVYWSLPPESGARVFVRQMAQELRAVVDAALAASAPQKEEK